MVPSSPQRPPVASSPLQWGLGVDLGIPPRGQEGGDDRARHQPPAHVPPRVPFPVSSPSHHYTSRGGESRCPKPGAPQTPPTLSPAPTYCFPERRPECLQAPPRSPQGIPREAPPSQGRGQLQAGCHTWGEGAPPRERAGALPMASSHPGPAGAQALDFLMPPTPATACLIPLSLPTAPTSHSSRSRGDAWAAWPTAIPTSSWTGRMPRRLCQSRAQLRRVGSGASRAGKEHPRGQWGAPSAPAHTAPLELSSGKRGGQVRCLPRMLRATRACISRAFLRWTWRTDVPQGATSPHCYQSLSPGGEG